MGHFVDVRAAWSAVETDVLCEVNRLCLVSSVSTLCVGRASDPIGALVASWKVRDTSELTAFVY